MDLINQLNLDHKVGSIHIDTSYINKWDQETLQMIIDRY